MQICDGRPCRQGTTSWHCQQACSAAHFAKCRQTELMGLLGKAQSWERLSIAFPAADCSPLDQPPMPPHKPTVSVGRQAQLCRSTLPARERTCLEAASALVTPAASYFALTFRPATRAGAKESLRARVKALRSTRLQAASDRWGARLPSRIVVLALMGGSSSTCRQLGPNP